MSSQTTDHPATIADQADALDVMVAVAESFPNLPAPYISVHSPLYELTVRIQLATSDQFEVWREALNADANQVTLHAPDMGRAWLNVTIQFLGVRVELSGHGVEIPRVSLVKAVAA